MNDRLHVHCRLLLDAYHSGVLGDSVMPEDSNPGFTDSNQEARLSYFTLPMALNYQRNSFTLWESSLATWRDPETREIFDVLKATGMSVESVREKLLRYRVALQPNKHVNTWMCLAHTFSTNWSGISGLFEEAENDYLKLRELVQVKHKKSFPYLSGPKIFNYWSYIISTYGKIDLRNRNFIEIAPDTHVIQCSIRLGVLTESEAKNLSRNAISDIWRAKLDGSGIDPIDMHSPLWFWSRSGFEFNIVDLN